MMRITRPSIKRAVYTWHNLSDKDLGAILDTVNFVDDKIGLSDRQERIQKILRMILKGR